MIRAARPEDLDAALALLRDAKLPTAGVAEAFEHFVVAEADDAGITGVAEVAARSGVADIAGVAEIAGVAGLELHGRCGLLRSVAVAPSARGRGLGGALTEAVLRRARDLGVDEVYLLTETASDYFPRHGFEQIERAAAAPAVQASAEFTTLCATTSTVMVRRER